MTFDEIRRLALQFPGMQEGTSYGTPAFRIGGRFLGRLHDSEPAFVLRMDLDTRDFVTKSRPDVFYVTDHYRDYPAVLVRYEAIDADDLHEYIEDAWRPHASRNQLASYEAAP
jgi:hypothetical protein